MSKTYRKPHLANIGHLDDARWIGFREQDKPVRVKVTEQYLVVMLQDRRIIFAPLAWYPALVQATPEQRSGVKISGHNLLWEKLDLIIRARSLICGTPETS